MENLENWNLDLLTNALLKGCVTILAGKGNVDETDLSLNAALQLGLSRNKSVAVMSDKTSNSDILAKSTLIFGNLKTDRVLWGDTSNADWQVLYCFPDALAKSRIFVNCKGGFSVNSAADELSAFASYAKLDVAVINLNLFNSFKNTEARKQFGSNLLKIRDVAKQDNCHVIVTTHCDTPFYEWRLLNNFVTDNIQLVQFFDENDLGLNFFGGKNDGKIGRVTYDETTGRFNIAE